MTARWEALYNDVETFLSAESIVYKCWQKQVFLGKQCKRHDQPLHIASEFGLVTLMKRYVPTQKFDVNMRNRDDDTPLHLAWHVASFP
jgi:hypothetical protein